ncbi:MAG: hypothetical protein Q9195_002408 [Heterodermia aff. obscurata]
MHMVNHPTASRPTADHHQPHTPTSTIIPNHPDIHSSHQLRHLTALTLSLQDMDKFVPGQQPQRPGYGGHTTYPPQQPLSHQHYGGNSAQTASPQEVTAYSRLLQTVTQEKQLQIMIPFNGPRPDRYAAVAPTKVQQYCNRFHILTEVGRDLVKLALFDIIL